MWRGPRVGWGNWIFSDQSVWVDLLLICFVFISVMIRDNFGRYIIFGAEECDGRPLTSCHVTFTPTCTAPDLARKPASYILFVVGQRTEQSTTHVMLYQFWTGTVLSGYCRGGGTVGGDFRDAGTVVSARCLRQFSFTLIKQTFCITLCTSWAAGTRHIAK